MMKLQQLVIALIFSLVTCTAFSQTPISIETLRSNPSISTTQVYMITDEGREGLFYYDAKDLSTPDNGGTVIVNGTKRFKRLYSGSIDVRWFGAKGNYNGNNPGLDNTAPIMAAINAAQRHETVFIPAGQYRIASNIVLPLTTVKKIKFEVFGDVYFERGAGFVIEGAYQDFRSYGLIAGLNSGANSEATFAAYSGAGVTLKNAVNCHIEVNEIKDFKYGINMVGESSSGPMGCQYNKVHFNSLHHNYAQIRIALSGSASGGNWNNASYWYGGQLGRGVKGTFGKGGWYGILFERESSATSGVMSGHMFYDIGFEGTEIGMKASHTEYTSLTNIRIEHNTTRIPLDLDPTNCVSTKIVGATYIDEESFAPGRLGNNTIIAGTPVWAGTSSSKAHMGNEAMTSINPQKLLVTTNKYTHTNFMVNKVNDLISLTGQYPTVQAMMYRINGVVRSVGFKKTFFNVKPSTSGSPLTLPANIGYVRVQAAEEKVFKIDSGDLVTYGDDFLVDYLTPKFPISFVRSDNNAVVIPSKHFTSAGTYRCVWVDGEYRVTKLADNYKWVKQDGPNWTVADDTETHFVDYGATATVTLPPADAWPGREITIKNLQAARNVQVVGVSALDESIIPGRGAMVVKSDGRTWNVISVYKRNLTY